MYLAEKVRREGGPFAVAHCNFTLRGDDSDADEAFVRNWALSYGVTCHVRRFDTEAFAASEGLSIEMAARRLRYHWFGELCREHGYEAVLTPAVHGRSAALVMRRFADQVAGAVPDVFRLGKDGQGKLIQLS